jgi:hypothetical protein
MFASFLGAKFDALPPAVRLLHDVCGTQRFVGRAKVTRGPSLWARFLAGLFRFPPAADDIPVTVVMTPHKGGELWTRSFDGRRFASFLKVKDGVMTERFGPLTFRIDLHVATGQLHYPVAAGRLGPVPLPKALLPVSVAREYEQNGRFHFDVALLAPLTGTPMVHYQGWLEPESPLDQGPQPAR